MYVYIYIYTYIHTYIYIYIYIYIRAQAREVRGLFLCTGEARPSTRKSARALRVERTVSFPKSCVVLDQALVEFLFDFKGVHRFEHGGPPEARNSSLVRYLVNGGIVA